MLDHDLTIVKQGQVTSDWRKWDVIIMLLRQVLIWRALSTKIPHEHGELKKKKKLVEFDK